MQPDLRCYYHPERQAVGQCDRCGDLLCSECMNEWGGGQLCATCRREYHAPCHDHPDVETVEQCARCGHFICADCARSWEDKLLCPACCEEVIPASARCRNHPQREPAGRCARCGAPVCAQCLWFLRAQELCEGCVDELTDGDYEPKSLSVAVVRFILFVVFVGALVTAVIYAVSRMGGI